MNTGEEVHVSGRQREPRNIIYNYFGCRRRRRRLVSRNADWMPRHVDANFILSPPCRTSYANRVSPLHHVLHVITAAAAMAYVRGVPSPFKNRARARARLVAPLLAL